MFYCIRMQQFKQILVFMVPCCVPLCYGFNPSHCFEEDGCHGDHFGYHEKENNFINSDSPFCPDAPHQVSGQSEDVEN